MSPCLEHISLRRLENDGKDSIFCHSTHRKAPFTARSENVHDFQSSAYSQKYYLFKKKILRAHIRKNTHLVNI